MEFFVKRKKKVVYISFDMALHEYAVESSGKEFTNVIYADFCPDDSGFAIEDEFSFRKEVCKYLGIDPDVSESVLIRSNIKVNRSGKGGAIFYCPCNKYGIPLVDEDSMKRYMEKGDKNNYTLELTYHISPIGVENDEWSPSGNI